MTFQKFNTANDAIALLNIPITSVSMSLELKAGFARFPTTNFLVKVTELDINDEIVSREIMLISTRSGNILNISAREYEAIPQNASSTNSVQESYDFQENAIVELVNTSKLYTDIQDEVTRLESDKLNKGGLRTALANAWRIFFSNGSNNETELTLGTAGTVLQSNGATSAPTWEVPTININSLTEDTTGNIVDDFFVKNNGTGANTKIKLTRYKATSGDINTGTNDNKYVSPLQLESTRKVNFIQGTRDVSAATGTQVLAHGLGYTPKWIKVSAFCDIPSVVRGLNIDGYSNGSINMCNGTNMNYNISGGVYSLNNASNFIHLYVDQHSGAGDWLTRCTATFDATNITLNWTTTGTSNPGGTIYFTIIAHS